MSMLTAHRNEMCFCPGCSHSPILEKLAAAIERQHIPTERVCIVSDIGCIGTADRYFSCHTFHGLHGRSITYAEGIKRARPELTVIVLIGDGGCGIGTTHLVHAARRNVDITVVVANNFNFGMTGGQQSPTTPEDAHTSTTPLGRTEEPFDICRTVAVSGAAFVARCSALEAELTDYLESAIATPGFAVVDIWELCVAYFVPANKLNPGKLVELSDQSQMPFGVMQKRTTHYLKLPPRKARSHDNDLPVVPFDLPWRGRKEICIAGSAGQHIRSAAGVIGELAVAGGLFAAQQDDFPITVRKGHSLSSLVVSANAIHYTGVDRADLLVILSEEGAARLNLPASVHPGCVVVVDEKIRLSGLRDEPLRVPLGHLEHLAGKNSAALAMLTVGLLKAGWMNPGQFVDAANAGLRGGYRNESLAAIRAATTWFEQVVLHSS